MDAQQAETLSQPLPTDRAVLVELYHVVSRWLADRESDLKQFYGQIRAYIAACNAIAAGIPAELPTLPGVAEIELFRSKHIWPESLIAYVRPLEGHAAELLDEQLQSATADLEELLRRRPVTPAGMARIAIARLSIEKCRASRWTLPVVALKAEIEKILAPPDPYEGYGYMTVADMASQFHIPESSFAAFKTAITRWKNDHPGNDEGWQQVEECGRTKHKYIYKPQAVSEIIEKYRSK